MEDSRDHILKTALTLFLEKSYKAVTFQELMKKTGFSKGAFFHYFKNKQEIFSAVIDRYVDPLEMVDFEALPQDGLKDFLTAYFPVARKKRTGFFAPWETAAANHYALVFEAIRLLPAFKEKMNRHEDKAVTGWTKVVAAARKKKEIKTSLSDLQVARLFIDASHGILIHLIMTDNVAAMEKEVTAAWNNLYGLMKT